MSGTTVADVDPEVMHLLVSDAARVIEGIREVLRVADTPRGRAWAEFRTACAQRQWEFVLDSIRSANPADFIDAILDVASNSTPLEDAPAELTAEVQQVLLLLDQLAEDYLRNVPPMLGADAELRPDVVTRLQPVLSKIAEEYA